MPKFRFARPLAWIGIPVLLLFLLVAVWNWDWFIPIVESRASAAIGRPVKIEHLSIRPGRVTTIIVSDVTVANPPDWPAGDPPLAAIKKLTIQADVLAYVRGHGLILPLIGIDSPRVFAAETADGAANFRLSTGGGGGGGVKIGDLRIGDGAAHVVIPRLKADFNAKVDTQGTGDAGQIQVAANGTYASQPITARLVGGTLLSLRDASHPWPVDLDVANGPTRVVLKGTLKDPLAFKGADVQLRFSGPDMGLLQPLVGFPIPKTPAYEIAGKLDLDGLDKITFNDFKGRLGSSDIAGSIEVKPSAAEAKGKTKPVVTVDLRSDRIDLTDLKGFLGGTPDKSANAAPGKREAPADAKLLPDTQINVPKLDWADIHLRYHGAHLLGRSMPLDDISVALDVVDGQIAVHPLSFGVGKGQLAVNVDVAPKSDKTVHARMNVRMRNLDVSRMMSATHAFQGAGTVNGVGAIEGTGHSIASLMANGNGEMKMAMAGGNLSAVMIDLTGLQFGNALLSALGVPHQTPIECFVGDLGLQRGVLGFKAMTLDTGEAITNVGGDVDLSKETIDLALKTDAKHFSVGSLPTRLNIGGTFKNPSIRPGVEAAARTGAAAGLGALFLPLAILPTVQFGTSEADDARCGQLLRQARSGVDGKALSPSPSKPPPAQ